MTDKADKEKPVQSAEYSIYSNSIQLKVSYYDFEIRFGVGKVTGEHQNIQSVYMSPQHTKVFKLILDKYIKDYEEKFSAITVPEELMAKINTIGDKK